MNKFKNGLFLDTIPRHQPDGTYRNLLNGVFDRVRGSIRSEDGLVEQDSYGFTASEVIGRVVLPDDRIILFTGTNSRSLIGTFDGSLTQP